MEKYLGRISGPMLDRIDLFVKVTALTYEELSLRPAGEQVVDSSAEIKARVNQARQIQLQRYGNKNNASMSQEDLEKYAPMAEDCEKMMEQAFLRFGLTGRSHSRLRRLSRTIADLDGSEVIESRHLSEALHYRPPDYLKR